MNDFRSKRAELALETGGLDLAMEDPAGLLAVLAEKLWFGVGVDAEAIAAVLGAAAVEALGAAGTGDEQHVAGDIIAVDVRVGGAAAQPALAQRVVGHLDAQPVVEHVLVALEQAPLPSLQRPVHVSRDALVQLVHLVKPLLLC